MWVLHVNTFESFEACFLIMKIDEERYSPSITPGLVQHGSLEYQLQVSPELQISIQLHHDSWLCKPFASIIQKAFIFFWRLDLKGNIYNLKPETMTARSTFFWMVKQWNKPQNKGREDTKRFTPKKLKHVLPSFPEGHSRPSGLRSPKNPHQGTQFRHQIFSFQLHLTRHHADRPLRQ